MDADTADTADTGKVPHAAIVRLAMAAGPDAHSKGYIQQLAMTVQPRIAAAAMGEAVRLRKPVSLAQLALEVEGLFPGLDREQSPPWFPKTRAGGQARPPCCRAEGMFWPTLTKALKGLKCLYLWRCKADEDYTSKHTQVRFSSKFEGASAPSAFESLMSTD